MDPGSEFLAHASGQFAAAFDRIDHAVRQLDDAHLWRRPAPLSNSVGIILQHLSGNLQQWVCSALGGERYERDRPSEFGTESRLARTEVLDSFRDLGGRVQQVIKALPASSLGDRRRVQGFDVTVLSALLKALCHLELHSGQIAYITKLLLGERYVEHWKPRTPEQGAA